jgi:hypothetical protein
VHPILADRRRFAAYMAIALPLAAATFALLTREPLALAPGAAALLALPLAVAGAALLLPAWYLCRALPPRETPWLRLLATHAGGAALAGVAWAWMGSGLARLAGSVLLDAGVSGRYEAHAAAVRAVGALLYVLACSFHYVLLALEATRRAEQQSLELAMLAREAELRALKAQVHPHFLFNSLNSISSLVASDPERAREMCILLAEFFRSSLALGEKPSVPLDEELTVARTYLAIERIRLGARLCVEEEIEEAVRAFRLPPLLLQPLVENAVRHGIATRAQGGTLRIEARGAGRQLRLSVENPFDADAPPRPGVGLGLSNVRRRLLARYGAGALVDVERSAERFRVTLHVPAEAEA